MTNYNDGKWHGWNGGECPVDLDSLVQTIWMHKNRDIRNDAREGVARGFPWGGNDYGDIIAFRVTKPAPPKPREWWIVNECEAYGSRAEADEALVGLMPPHKIIHVREVIE